MGHECKPKHRPLGHHLKALKLPTMLRKYAKVAATCAKRNVGHRGFLTRLKGQLAKLDLLILDELGYVPASKLGAERLAGTTLDRLTHRCHVLEANGQSYRLKDAKKRRKAKRSTWENPRGWTPLPARDTVIPSLHFWTARHYAFGPTFTP